MRSTIAALFVLALPLACDCPDRCSDASAGGDPPPAEACPVGELEGVSQAFDDGWHAGYLGPWPLAAPKSWCPEGPDDAAETCVEWWSGVLDGMRARARCIAEMG